MQTVALGRQGIQVSKLCFGTLTMSHLQAGLSPREGARLLTYAHSLGVHFLDTADLYQTYPHIREALREVPGFKISTKAYCWDEKTAREAVERAFRGIGRDYVDLFMLHEQESIHTLRGHAEALKYLNRLKEQGHIGAVGVSTHYIACVSSAARFGGIDVIHPMINRTGIGIADGSRAQMEDAIRVAHDSGIGILAMKVLGGGHLIGDADASLQYALDAPWIDSIALGMQSMEEIRYNVARFSREAPSEKDQSLLRTARRKLLIDPWCEGCGRCVERCAQKALRIVEGKATVEEERCVLCGYCASVCLQFCMKVI